MPAPELRIRRVATTELKQKVKLIERLGGLGDDSVKKHEVLQLVGFPDSHYDHLTRRITIVDYEDKRLRREIGSTPTKDACHEFCHYLAHSRREWKNDRTREEYNAEEDWARELGHGLYDEYLQYQTTNTSGNDKPAPLGEKNFGRDRYDRRTA